MPRREHTVERQATLYTRGDVPEPAIARREAVVAELGALVADGALDSFEVVHWAKRVPADADGTREHGLVDAFREWADAEGVSLEPCFDTRECYGARSGDFRTELVLPVLCLAVFADDHLVDVAPHETADGVVTVGDRLATLREAASEDEGEDVGEERVVMPAE